MTTTIKKTKKDIFNNNVNIGDAIHIRVVTGRYGQTKDYEGIVTDFDIYGNVELDGQKSLSYKADYTSNDYEHGHHIFVEKINPKDIKDNLRVPKKYVPKFSGEIDGKRFAIQGEKEFKNWAENNYCGSIVGSWYRLHNDGWRYLNGEYFCSKKNTYKEIRVHQSAEHSSGYLLSLMIPINKNINTN
jgi:hypothetical protein